MTQLRLTGLRVSCRRSLLTAVIVALGVIVVSAAGNPPSNPYLEAEVRRDDLAETIAVAGTIRPVGVVDVGSQFSGQITELLVDFNDVVAKGQPLAVIDPVIYEARRRRAQASEETARSNVAIHEASLDRSEHDLRYAQIQVRRLAAGVRLARAALTNAEQDLNRKRRLAEASALSQGVLDDAVTAHQAATAGLQAALLEQRAEESTIGAREADIEIARAQLEHARSQLEQSLADLELAELELARTVIRAPIDGVVISRDVEQGQTVAASLQAPTLFTLAADLARMEVSAVVDEAEIGRIRQGQEATFVVDAHPHRVFRGRVTQIRRSPVIVGNVVTYRVLIGADNPDALLLPGMTAVLSLVVGNASDVIQVSNQALQFVPADMTADVPDGMAVVWVQDTAGQPRPRYFTPGLSNRSATQVIGDLRPGERVITGLRTPQ